MDERKEMVIANGRIITSDVKAINFNHATSRYDITFKNDRVYTYNFCNVLILKDPVALDPTNIKIRHGGVAIRDIKEVLLFKHVGGSYYYVRSGRRAAGYSDKELEISFSCLDIGNPRGVFAYMSEIAKLNQILTDDGKVLLGRIYDEMDFVSSDTALAAYLQPNKFSVKQNSDFLGLFPYGINRSQYKAVRSSLENSVSIIQGPPGTGKTQTILNIICNIIANNKTVLVVSNNNTAVENVLEKLSAPEFDISFMIAKLGKADNKKEFAKKQPGYPNLTRYLNNIPNLSQYKTDINGKLEDVCSLFGDVERLSKLKQELADIEIEYKHFERLAPGGAEFKKRHSAEWLKLWCALSNDIERKGKPSLRARIKIRCWCGLKYKQYSGNFDELLLRLQGHYYKRKIAETYDEIQRLEERIKKDNLYEKTDELKALSKDYLSAVISKRFAWRERPMFAAGQMVVANKSFKKEYPIVLSTTFASRSNLGTDGVFDYVIIDEASQVDVTTGVLALSCAKNAVIVGDDRQLPNIVTEQAKSAAQKVAEKFNVDSAYDYTKNSFLRSVAKVIKQAPVTLLKEHYRCHPKIINFCNQKFYNGQLMIMTKDNGEKDVLSVTRTVEGNHSRGHLNRRQIDVVRKEILPELTKNYKDIGVIAPYKDQINATREVVNNSCIDIATVHKFQGQERSAVVLMTVDDKINDFSDDPYLLNVAISRAKHKLEVVVSGNELQDSNIADLVNYIEYNNCAVRNSAIRSVFDFLYTQYTQMRLEYLDGLKRVSVYDSENLMYSLIRKVLKELDLYNYNVVVHVPLRTIIADFSLMNEEQNKYVMQSGTHVDFLVYNRINKKTVLAVEVDGFDYHKAGTKQNERDKLKDSVFELYSLPYFRFATNGSGEEEALREFFQRLKAS